MSKIKEWADAKQKRHDAESYISIIGKTTTATTVADRQGIHATAGKLHKLAVSTQMHFHPYDGATNYHDCKAFDAALSAVVRNNWDALKDQAMALLKAQERSAAIDARGEVEAQLNEIIKAEQGK
jgi:hypothetical protein